MFALFLVATASAVYISGPVGVDAAKESAVQFLDNSGADVQYQEEDHLDIGDYYVFSTGNGKVYVNMNTGIVERASFNDARKSSGKVLIDSTEAEKISKEYARENYDGFDDKNMQLTYSKLIDHVDAGYEYSIVWRENIEGALTPNFVAIDINAESGEISSYIGIHRDIDCSVKPQISEEDALKIAEKQFPGIEVSKSESYLSIEYTKPDIQSLIWVITLKGEPANYSLYGGTVVIDAVNGNVLMTSGYC